MGRESNRELGAPHSHPAHPTMNLTTTCSPNGRSTNVAPPIPLITPHSRCGHGDSHSHVSIGIVGAASPIPIPVEGTASHIPIPTFIPHVSVNIAVASKKLPHEICPCVHSGTLAQKWVERLPPCLRAQNPIIGITLQ